MDDGKVAGVGRGKGYIATRLRSDEGGQDCGILIPILGFYKVVSYRYEPRKGDLRPNRRVDQSPM